MTRYKIPQKHLAGFTELASLSAEQRRQLLDTIETTEIGEESEKLGRALATKLQMGDDQIESILQSLQGAIMTKESITDPPEKFAKDIAQSYIQQSKDKKDGGSKKADLTEFLL